MKTRGIRMVDGTTYILDENGKSYRLNSGQKDLWKACRRISGLARCEREHPRWKIPGTKDAGIRSTFNECCDRLYRRLCKELGWTP